MFGAPRRLGTPVTHVVPNYAVTLLGEYRASLKALDVEEPIDLALHRPLAFVIAKLALPTAITPNGLTAVSTFFGVLGGVLLVTDFAWAAIVAGALLFVSQVIDSSDGMLARMRKTSSDLGRMLDGVSDTLVLLTASIGSIVVMTRHYASPWYAPWLVVALSVLTMHTSSFHTTAYDHYKNMYMRLVLPNQRDEEDLEQALERKRRADENGRGLVHAVTWFIYLVYLKSGRRFFEWFDPYTVTRAGVLPPYDPERAAIYKKHALPLMKIWRSAFGVGSLVFGLAIFNAFGRPDIFLLFRLVFLNAVFFGYLGPAQRRATRAAFEEMGFTANASREAIARA